MSETKFTPGPWSVGKSPYCVVSESSKGLDWINGCIGDEAIEYYGGNLIAETVHLCNVSLIAAAPDLHEALDALFRAAQKQGFTDSYKSEMAKAKKALKKARGEA